MSNRQPDMDGVTFEPVKVPPARIPGAWLFALSFAYPIAVVLLELFSRMCASAFFDPMPTWGHVFAVCFVPVTNLLVWSHLQDVEARNARWLVFMIGCAIAIGGFYALLFLPLVPLAIIGVVVAVGLLPLAPFAALAGALKLMSALRARYKDQSMAKPLLGGIAAGIALTLLLDAPGAATRLGIQWATSDTPAQRERGLALLRTFGDDDLLLRLCYGMTGQQTGLLGALFAFENTFDFRPRRTVSLPSAGAREIYYRLHGEPFNAKPAPFDPRNAIRFGAARFDNDHGGTQVGGRLNGLSMVASRLDGSVNGDDAVAYLEWTVEFRNTDVMDREARLQFALPPRGVVSRATLWVNGEEREAAYGGRGAVRAAYQRVAVQQRRDPLLVTTRGADRVLAQAFPVPRDGGTIKFKLGITAPLDVVEPGQARLVLPSIIDRNFSFTDDVRHNVWIESKRQLAVSAGKLAVERDGSKPFRISGAIGDNDLSIARPVITVERNPDVGRVMARIGENDPVVQSIVRGGQAAPATLMLVVDGSARLAGTTLQLVKALDAIPQGLKVGAIIATDPVQQIAPAPWSEAHKQTIVKLIRSTPREGGQDNAPALANALIALEAEHDATLLWVHGPQPVIFRGSSDRLEQAATRLSRLPRLVLYGVEPGPNELLPDMSWAWSAQSLPKTASLQIDLARFFAGLSKETSALSVQRSADIAPDNLPKGSDHIARLWANDRVLDLMRSNPSANRDRAVTLASKYRLVTPVSGAVVLETKQQYDESRLTPAEKGTVPTVPEPHEWALALIACVALLWLAWRQRRQIMAAA
ncbi:MAG: hypothetical protein K2Y27_32540 [Xanthobacteraceae bacterium]|nr:hypothetical protein [Xanthobacteraceae bacterium]